jgi:hypothetical protein
MSLRVLVQDDVVYEGASVPVPRVGDHIRRGDDVFPVEAVTWEFGGGDAVVVTLVVGTKPYTY